MRKRRYKNVQVSIRVTKNMHNRLEEEWKKMLKEQPDLTFASAVREVVRRGLALV